MPASKSLTQHVVDGTFRPRRHRELLAGPVVRWPTLAVLQAAYAGATSDAERRAVAVRFLEAMRKLEQEETEDPFHVELEKILTGPPSPMTFVRGSGEIERYWRAMEAAACAADGWATKAIAQRLTVSPATVRRDLSWLEQLDLPAWLNPWEPWKPSSQGS